MRFGVLLKSMLIAAALGLKASSTEAKTIKIYVRSQDDTEIGVYAFNRYGQKNNTWSDYEAFGTKDAQWSAKTTETIGGHTWYVSTYDTDKLKAIVSSPSQNNDVIDSYFSIQFHNAGH